MLNLHVSKIIAYLIERVGLFLYPSCPVHSIQETSIEVVTIWTFSCFLDTFLFSVNLIVFAFKNFLKQLMEKIVNYAYF